MLCQLPGHSLVVVINTVITTVLHLWFQLSGFARSHSYRMLTYWKFDACVGASLILIVVGIFTMHFLGHLESNGLIIICKYTIYIESYHM
ncbi:hypothetical protein JHK85_007120 [Glycine max]|uniref:Uncharacterized protein n=1 Tax=Glycine soja TaxID=3848 RepID=A0A445L969_GLYSO|nr:hypothetical protein JHK87_006763 [Glycine soja]KAG5054610.1 hypothetical protein JHK85_007120 [Glycine max]KAG5071715.1 hypothetical protein JHK86_006926 [Glycine max]RZC19826.1 hypothetical protein D0Y65_006607 [Glycine soja]